MSKIQLIGFAEATLTNDILNLIQDTGQDCKILVPDNFFAGKYDSADQFIVTVTRDRTLRKEICDLLDQRHLSRATFIHATAVIAKNSTVEGGTFIGPCASTFYQSHIGKDCIIGPYSFISHKTTIGRGCLIHPGTMIAGSTIIGEYCLTGIRSTIIDHLNICNDVIIGAGALVTKSITQPGNYVGVRARKVK